MLLARRFYLYFIAAVSLTTLAVGLTNLLDLLFRWSWERISDASLLATDPDEIRRQLSIHIALVIVSLPIWLLHWWLIERAVTRVGNDAEVERRSALRALYLTAGLTIPFIFWVVNAIRVVEAASRRVLDVEQQYWSRTDIESALAILLVTGAIWTYHAWTRTRDQRSGPLEHVSDWLPRLYLLAAAATGALALLFGLAELLALAVEAIVGDRSSIVEGNIWSGAVAGELGAILVGLGIWLLHWGYMLRTVSGSDWRARSLGRSVLWYVYIYVLALVGVFATLLFVGSSLQTLLNEILGGTSSSEPFTLRLIGPLARALPFAAIWVYHRVFVLGDHRSGEPSAARTTLQRVYTYAIALSGLAVAAFGSAAILYLTFDRILDPGQQIVDLTDSTRRDLSNFIALTIVGVTAWLWHWYRVQQWVQHDPAEERAATPRRVYLLATIAGSVIALLGSLAVMIYRLLAVVLDVADAGLRTDLSAPIAIFIVAGAVLAYHGTILRADLAARPDTRRETVEITFTISGPAVISEAELTEVVRTALPPDFDLYINR